MKASYPYTNLENVLYGMKRQIKDSLIFASAFIPLYCKTPKQIFDFLKSEVTYEDDPKGVELLQSMQTLFSDKNKHGIYGAGDCDCFTIAAIACLYCKGYRNLFIVLAGRRSSHPVHVYANVNGIPFDLTNDEIGVERKYQFKQILEINL